MNPEASVDIKAFIDARNVSAYQWLVLLLCFFIVMMDGLDTAVMGFVAPVIMHDWSVARAAFGPVMSAAMIAQTGARGTCRSKRPISQRIPTHSPSMVTPRHQFTRALPAVFRWAPAVFE